MHYLQWADHLIRKLWPTGDQPGTWYIRPSDDLLEATEVERLFTSIRTWWLGEFRQPYTVRALRQRLRELRPDQALPLLYSMSYVARSWGRDTEFWPQFREHVLENKVERDIMHMLASDLTSLWKAVHSASNGALYYPPEGRSNIKWPLTHAGLLSDEEDYLQRFGRDLTAEWSAEQSELHPLLCADVDDFQTALLAWLTEERLGFRPFAKRLKSDYTGMTVALMAQGYLRQIWHQLRQQVPGKPTGGRSRYRYIRPRLRYDADLNQMQLMLADAQWNGRVDAIRVEHDGHNEIWPTYYDASSNTTYSRSVEIPLPHPQWGPSITLKIAQEPLTFPLLSSPFSEDSGAILFDSVTGTRTRTFKPGESYYLALPQSMVDATWRKILFPEVSPLGNPFRIRNGYDMLQVTACEVESLLEADRLDQLNDELIKAGAIFRLPPLVDLTRPQFRLVGGLPLADRTNSIPLFHVDQPPLLEVSGAFPAGLTVGLIRLVSGARTQTIASAKLGPSQSAIRSVIALFGSDEPEPGQYRVSVGPDSTEFRIGEQTSSPMYPHQLQLAFCPEAQPVTGTDFGYHLLQDGTFSGTAWPGALLTVIVKRPGHRTDRFTRQLVAEKDGSFTFRLEDYYHDAIPPAPLEVAVEDRFDRSTSLTFAEQAYFRTWSTIGSDQGLHLSAQVVQVQVGTPVTAIAFGEAPWNGQIWHADGRVGTNGKVELTFKDQSRKIRYVAVAEGAGKRPCSVPWLAVRIAPVAPRTGLWRLDGDASLTAWAPWAKAIANCTAADREVQQLAAFSQVRHSLPDIFPAVRPPQSGWCRPGATLQADLPVLLQFVAAPRVAIVESTKPLPAATTYVGDATGPTPGIPLQREMAIALVKGTVPNEGLPIALSEGRWQAGVTLRPAGAPPDAHLEAKESLMLCHDCGRILPRYGAEYHIRPNTHEHALCRTFTQIFPGQRIAATLAVECLPQRLGSCVAELIADTSRHNRLPPAAQANTDLVEWFKQVTQYYPRGFGAPTPTRWGREIATAAGDLAMLILYPHLPVDPERLSPVVAVYEQYPEAVLSVMTRLLTWVKEGDD